jgi:metallo-beta-lactamase class B
VVLLSVLAPLASACAPSAPPAPAPAAPAAPAQPAHDGDPRTPDAPILCSSCADWNRPHEPFKLFGNTYYVGPGGLSSVLIATAKGLVLLDGGLPQSAAVIDENIRKLGFRTQDIKLIVNSHAHFDHAGGIAALQQLSGARVAASASGARAIEHGEPGEDDPQYGSGHDQKRRFAAVPHVEVVSDGQPLTVGDTTITAHLTPGHTPGSTTWTWRSCEAAHCINVVYADSLNPVSDDGFRFTRSPSVVTAFRASIETIDHLPCDLIVSVHPSFTALDDKLAARTKGATPDPFLDGNGCHAYAADATEKLTKRIADEH